MKMSIINLIFFVEDQIDLQKIVTD